jgi:ADP-ribose pyrophosphatase
MKPERLSRTVVYENPWVNLYIDKVQFPDGRIIEKHHLLDFEKEAVAVLVENVQSQILLVHVYRYTTDTIEWEIPAGVVEDGESILEAARWAV